MEEEITNNSVTTPDLVADLSTIKNRPLEDYDLVSISGIPFYHYEDDREEFYVSLDLEKVFQDEKSILMAHGKYEGGLKGNTLQDITNNTSESNIDVVEEIRKLLKQFVKLPDEDYYTLLALYTILTYCYLLFDRIPYLYFRGEKGSGKSTAMLLCGNLSNRPQIYADMTAAALFSLIQDYRPTLLLDEFEAYQKRHNGNSLILSVLISGYQKNGSIARKVKGVAVSYPTFGPKIIAGINQVAPATEDRCIIVRLNKASESVNINPLVEDAEFENMVGEIKNLITSILPKIGKHVISSISNLSELGINKKIRNRDLDKWLPILILARFFSTVERDYFNAMTNLALKDMKLKEEEEAQLPENACGEIIKGFVSQNHGKTLIPDNNYYYFRAETIQDCIRKLDLHNSYRSKADITKVLKRIGIETDWRRIDGAIEGLYKIPKSFFSRSDRREVVNNLDTNSVV
jgi:hypothetical protein